MVPAVPNAAEKHILKQDLLHRAGIRPIIYRPQALSRLAVIFMSIFKEGFDRMFSISVRAPPVS